MSAAETALEGVLAGAFAGVFADASDGALPGLFADVFDGAFPDVFVEVSDDAFPEVFDGVFDEAAVGFGVVFDVFSEPVLVAPFGGPLVAAMQGRVAASDTVKRSRASGGVSMRATLGAGFAGGEGFSHAVKVAMCGSSGK